MPMTKGSTALGSLTYAALVASYPASAWTNYTAFVTNWGANGTSVRSNGTRWLPSNGQTVLKRMGSAVSGITNTETVVAQIQLPAGVLQAGDVIRVVSSMSKSGSTDVGQHAIHIGTAGTTSDAAVMAAITALVAANQSGGILSAVRVISNTSVLKTGGNSALGPYGGSANGAAASAVTISDASSNALYISYGVKSGGATDTVAVQEVTIIHEAS